MKLYTILPLPLLVAISNAQSNLYNFNNNNDNNNIIDNNGNGQQTHKLALHNHKTIINSRYNNLATADIDNRRLKNRNNNESKREDIAKPNKRNKREKEKREDTKIGDDIAIAMTEDYDRKYNTDKRAQRKKNELVAAASSGNEEEVESGDKRRHKDKKNEEESNEVADNVEEEGTSKEKKRTSQHTAAQSTKNEHQKRQKRGVNNEMINIFRNRISNINGSKQYKEDIAGGMSFDYTIPTDMSMGKHAKQSKRHSKSVKSVKSKVDKRPTSSPTESASPTPTMESASPTPTMESSSPTPTSTSSESPTPESSSEPPTMDESCELYPDQDPIEVCPPDKYCKVDCKLKTLPWFGVCTTMPDYCVEIYKPVCGCDFETEYGNACKAEAMGVNVAYDRKCDVNTKPPISSSPTSSPSHGPSSSPTTMASIGPTASPSKEVSFCVF